MIYVQKEFKAAYNIINRVDNVLIKKVENTPYKCYIKKINNKTYKKYQIANNIFGSFSIINDNHALILIDINIIKKNINIYNKGMPILSDIIKKNPKLKNTIEFIGVTINEFIAIIIAHELIHFKEAIKNWDNTTFQENLYEINNILNKNSIHNNKYDNKHINKLYLKLLPFNKKLNNDILNEEAFKAYPYEVKFEKKLRHLKKINYFKYPNPKN